ncbi:hypothetical protein RH868_004548 [Salmonella enterica]|nr:hypothetical protein [Salmonella enterica]ELB8087633.1 hypothetical protein [Salmonella enterica]ELJ1895344.1 hypothetical protein [Salmonella enterica]
MDKLLNAALNELSTVFLLRFEMVHDFTEELPFQLKKAATAYILRIEGRELLFISCPKLSYINANNFLNLRRLIDKINIPVVVVLKTIDSQSKSFLKNNNVGWVVPGRASYIPSMLMNYTSVDKSNDKNLNKANKSFGVIPSYIIAYYLSYDLPLSFSAADLVLKMDVSKMAISRALKELLAESIIEEVNDFKPKVYTFCIERKILWLKYRERISSLSTGFMAVSAKKISEYEVFPAGESALSMYSDMLSPNQPQVGVCMGHLDRYLRPITPATIDGDYLFKSMGFIEYNQDVGDGEMVLLQIFPYKVVLEGFYLNRIFLALSRFNKNDLRIKSTFLELETDIVNSFK